MIYAENILLCIAIPFIIAAVFSRGHTRRFIISFLAGMVSCLIAAYISGFIDAVKGVDETALFISPIIEEIMKMLRKQKKISLRELIACSGSRTEIIAAFMAVLDLCVSGKIMLTGENADVEIGKSA